MEKYMNQSYLSRLSVINLMRSKLGLNPLTEKKFLNNTWKMIEEITEDTRQAYNDLIKEGNAHKAKNWSAKYLGKEIQLQQTFQHHTFDCVVITKFDLEKMLVWFKCTNPEFEEEGNPPQEGNLTFQMFDDSKKSVMGGCPKCKDKLAEAKVDCDLCNWSNFEVPLNYTETQNN